MNHLDDDALQRALTDHLRDAAPSPRGDALSRLMQRVGASPQRSAWRVRAMAVASGLASGRSMGTLAVAAGALVVGVMIGQLWAPVELGSEPSPSAVPTSSRASWEEPESYSFVLEGCGPNDPVGTLRIFVAAGIAVSFDPLDEPAQRYQGYPAEEMPTLGWMMAQVAEAESMTEPWPLPAELPPGSPEVVERSLPDVRLVTDPVDGHPVELYIDWIPEAIDDEVCYSVREFDISPDTSWGPMAVLDAPDGAPHGQAAATGVVRITEECVFLEQNGRSVLLIWDGSRVSWDAETSTISHRNDDGTVFVVSDGMEVEVGGGSAQGFPVLYLERADWLSAPRDACRGGGFVVGSVGEPQGEASPVAGCLASRAASDYEASSVYRAEWSTAGEVAAWQEGRRPESTNNTSDLRDVAPAASVLVCIYRGEFVAPAGPAQPGGVGPQGHRLLRILILESGEYILDSFGPEGGLEPETPDDWLNETGG